VRGVLGTGIRCSAFTIVHSNRVVKHVFTAEELWSFKSDFDLFCWFYGCLSIYLLSIAILQSTSLTTATRATGTNCGNFSRTSTAYRTHTLRLTDTQEGGIETRGVQNLVPAVELFQLHTAPHMIKCSRGQLPAAGQQSTFTVSITE